MQWSLPVFISPLDVSPRMKEELNYGDKFRVSAMWIHLLRNIMQWSQPIIICHVNVGPSFKKELDQVLIASTLHTVVFIFFVNGFIFFVNGFLNCMM